MLDYILPRRFARPDVAALKQQQAYNVEVALLHAESELERAEHTVSMLRQRLKRLRHDESNAPAGVPASP